MIRQLTLEIIVKFISVGSVIVKENFMNMYRKIILLMFLTMIIVLINAIGI